MKRTRKAIYILMLLLGMSNSIRAQNEVSQKFIVGLRGGLSFAPTDWSFSEINIFPSIGIATSCNISKSPLYLETGLYYTNRYVSGSANHSLLVPALLTYHIPSRSNKSIQPFAGPFISYGFDEAAIDGGIRLGIGFNFSNFYINCGYDLSMSYGVDEDALFINIGYNL